MNEVAPKTKLDKAIELVPENIRERVLRVMVDMGVDVNDPAFAWAIAAGHIHLAIESLPTALRAEAETQLKDLKDLFESGHAAFAAETADLLKKEVDKAVADHSQVLRDLMADVVKAECKRIDGAGEQLGKLLASSEAGLNTVIGKLKKLPDNMAKTIIDTAFLDKMPALVEQAVKDRLVSQEKTRRTLSVALIGGVMLASALLGGSTTWLFEWRVRMADHAALEAAQTAAVSQKLGESREILALARPFDESLRDPIKRARLEWAQVNPATIDIMRTAAGQSMLKLVAGYRGAEDVRAPYPCITMGPRMNINGSIVAKTCTVALPNE